MKTMCLGFFLIIICGLGLVSCPDDPPAVKQCAPPVITPQSGFYTAPLSISITSELDNAEIRYTIDESAPGAATLLYQAPFELTTSTTVRAITVCPGYANSAETVATYSVAVPLGTWTIGPAGGNIDLVDPQPGVASFHLTAAAAVLPGDVDFEILLHTRTENEPLHFSLASACIEVRPQDLEIDGTILIGLSYLDENDDGILDETTIPESEIYPAYYDETALCWGPLEIQSRDTAANVIWFTTNHLEPFALWGAQEDSDPEHTLAELSMHMIGYDWTDWVSVHGEPPLLPEAAAADLAAHGIDTVFIGAFGPDPDVPGQGSFVFEDDGYPTPAGITAYTGWFSLADFITAAHSHGLTVVVSVDCFTENSPPHNAVHRAFLLDVIDFLLSYYACDGIMLDHIRYNDYETATVPAFSNIDAVTSFVRDLKENHAGGLPIWLNLMRFYNGDFEILVGQRYADLAAVCDYLCPMLYYRGEEWLPLLEELILRANITRTAANGVKVVPSLRTWWDDAADPMSGAELDSQLQLVVERYTDGAAFFRYVFMDGDKWSTVESY